MTIRNNADKDADADKRFDASLNSVLHIDKKDYPCYVGGLKIASGNEFIVKSPVDESIQFGRFQEPEIGLSDRAADVALSAFRTWSKTDKEKRTEIFEKVSDTIKKQKYRIAAAVTLSSGMTREDSIYEVERLIEVIDDNVHKVKEGIKGRPYGVWTVISEYNSPLAAPIGHSISAILAGNTVILIPPKECPFPSYMMYDIISSAGLPDGVLNVIYDRKGKVMSNLAENENIAGIVATGRSDRFEELMFSAVNEGTVLITEFKGMNPILVYKPLSMQVAADIVISSAFGYAGQRIDSCSKVIITAGEEKQFIHSLLTSAKKITVGDPAEKGTFVGPVISNENMKKFLDIVDEAKDNIIFGGKRVLGDETSAGYYVMPAIFANLSEEHVLNIIDNSLPILSIHAVNDLEDAFEMIGDCEFGLSMGIISKDENVTKRFMAEADADIVRVNGSIMDVAMKADVNEFVKK